MMVYSKSERKEKDMEEMIILREELIKAEAKELEEELKEELFQQ
jgi:hypothetical protein